SVAGYIADPGGVRSVQDRECPKLSFRAAGIGSWRQNRPGDKVFPPLPEPQSLPVVSEAWAYRRCGNILEKRRLAASTQSQPRSEPWPRTSARISVTTSATAARSTR